MSDEIYQEARQGASGKALHAIDRLIAENHKMKVKLGQKGGNETRVTEYEEPVISETPLKLAEEKNSNRVIPEKAPSIRCKCGAGYGDGQKLGLPGRFCSICGELMPDPVREFVSREKQRLLSENPNLPKHVAHTQARKLYENQFNQVAVLSVEEPHPIESKDWAKQIDASKIFIRKEELIARNPEMSRTAAHTQARKELTTEGKLLTVRSTK